MIDKRLRIHNNTDFMNGYQAVIERAATEFRVQYYPDLIQRYREGWRFYHNLEHLGRILTYIYQDETLSDKDRLIMVYIAFYHDAIYDPTRYDNEEKSAQLFASRCGMHENCKYEDLSPEYRSKIINGILYTNVSAESFPFPILDLYKKFRKYDTVDFINYDLRYLLKGEKNIQKEYQFVDWNIYKNKKTELLLNLAQNEESKKACDFLIDLVMTYTPKIGIYAGSFDPFHVGHLSVLRQAEKVFDKVIILVGPNPGKAGSVNSLDERYTNVRKLLPYHQVKKFTGYLTDYLQSLNYETTLIRGLRTDTDFKQEQVQLRIMQDLYPDLNVMFITCDKDVEHVASSYIRMMEQIRKGSESKYTLTTEEIYNGLESR